MKKYRWITAGVVGYLVRAIREVDLRLPDHDAPVVQTGEL